MLEVDSEYCGSLKRAGILTRDPCIPRMKERKKTGFKGACRLLQCPKRLLQIISTFKALLEYTREVLFCMWNFMR
ncbi:30S ribosomal protein S9 [Mammaliicoccus vitulinus]|uniref:Small ribosomal subunit protein uS9 n=1 Tax=Mammaliicoccus vitulinus TaxID=71237 RepID=A0A2T4PTZ0_9STAP|nr:30S ribosomal protein S9 [Mammaliicoccus vitulinus]PTI68985.1 30S ribosomal protein S9 [Mammaliicoccus vitulinus]RIN17192.1 30S ribosomal protein S9 [Mammaliicoccus vitulinus]RIN18671.1 30S ribosomal protein S9 [Mammaliicoccus vitulinus]